MRIPIVKDGWIWILGPVAVGGPSGGWAWTAGLTALAVALWALSGIISLFMLYFFRNPERTPPAGENLVIAGADGLIRSVEDIEEKRFIKGPATRISIFLSPFNVHVNRSPIGGTVQALEYVPGRHFLTYDNRASELNEHSAILIEGAATRCLVKQIVGPGVRRVVYWLQLDQKLAAGDRIGMMKFGSRLDMIFPRGEVEVTVRKGDRVRAGLTVVAKTRPKGSP